MTAIEIHDLIGEGMVIILTPFAIAAALVAVFAIGVKVFSLLYYGSDSADLDAIGSHLTTPDGKAWDFSKDKYSDSARAQRDVKPGPDDEEESGPDDVPAPAAWPRIPAIRRGFLRWFGRAGISCLDRIEHSCAAFVIGAGCFPADSLNCFRIALLDKPIQPGACCVFFVVIEAVPRPYQSPAQVVVNDDFFVYAGVEEVLNTHPPVPNIGTSRPVVLLRVEVKINGAGIHANVEKEGFWEVDYLHVDRSRGRIFHVRLVLIHEYTPF